MVSRRRTPTQRPEPRAAPRGAAVTCALLATAALLGAPPARAGGGGARAERGDAALVRFHSSTYLQLYQRALLPGPNGALVTTDTIAPVYEYVSLRADDLDTLGEDDTSVELSAWGAATATEDFDTARRLDGDLQTANVRLHAGPSWVRLGRQVIAGGAARFARFDGAAAGSRLAIGLGMDAYAGLSVLPRWSGRPGYAQLGAAADTLLREPEALPEARRSGYWLAGGRASYERGPLVVGASFHEEHASSELARRSLGGDFQLEPLDWASAGGAAVLDLDGLGLADARLWADTVPARGVGLGVEYLHTEPALLLSRQSVLSVFSADTFDELGATASWRPLALIGVEGGGYLQHYSAGDAGARGDLALRVAPDREERTVLRLGLARVRAPGNGYTALRDSLRQRIAGRVTATAEAYLYLYDEAISGRRIAEVYAGTVEWRALDELRLLFGSSLARTPYADADLQALVRATYGLDGKGP
ncbi:MAG: hypothetical protein OZ921_20570 [Sorangiineae bacterium]|nr:hypothetical protein [Polyangiaceae bacterium]MEB2324920.1 hypothetical protein [Sorangiineae bacterium]